VKSSERVFQRKVLQYLRERGGLWRTASPLPYGHTGDPDIYGVYNGRPVFIELKAPGKYKDPRDGLTDLQRQVLEEIWQSRGLALCTDKLGDIRDLLDAIDEGRA
jgi:hypothetical protein